MRKRREKFVFVIFAVYLFLGITCWLWAYLFVSSLLRAIQNMLAKEDFKKPAQLACLSLILLAMSPFVISLFHIVFGT